MKRTREKQEETPRTIHVVHRDGQFKVYDEQNRFRAGFVSEAIADAYVERLKMPRPFVTTTIGGQP